MKPFIVSNEIYNIIEHHNKQNNMNLKEIQEARQAQKESDLEVIKNWNSTHLQGPKRLETESFSEYKDRRRQENLWYKLYTSPGAHLVWLSKTAQEDTVNNMMFWSPGNTYIKEVHGNLGRD